MTAETSTNNTVSTSIEIIRIGTEQLEILNDKTICTIPITTSDNYLTRKKIIIHDSNPNLNIDYDKILESNDRKLPIFISKLKKNQTSLITEYMFYLKLNERLKKHKNKRALIHIKRCLSRFY
jgi:hypothetical protein